MFTTRLAIAALIFPMVHAVFFGAGLVTVLAVPALADHAMALIPTVIFVGFVVGVPLSWMLAPRLRAAYLRGQGTADEL